MTWLTAGLLALLCAAPAWAGDAASGERLFRVQCGACHSADYVTTQPRLLPNERAFWQGEVTKMKAAYGFLGQQFDTNPVGFRGDFGKEAAGQLLAYRNALAFLPPDIAAKRVQGWTDPAQEETRMGVASTAKDELKSLTADQVAQKFSSFSFLNPATWDGVRTPTPNSDAAATSAEGLRNDYAQAYTYQRQLGMDAAHADKNALQVLGTKWGVSETNGGNLMQFPPEAKFPSINGSHDWIAEQLDKEIYEVSGASKARPQIAASYGEPKNSMQRQEIMARQAPLQYPDSPDALSRMNVYTAPRALAADTTTEADINAGRPPSYYIAVKDSRGLWNPLTDQDGKLVRFRPDPKAVPSVAAVHAPGFQTGTQPRASDMPVYTGP